MENRPYLLPFISTLSFSFCFRHTQQRPGSLKEVLDQSFIMTHQRPGSLEEMLDQTFIMTQQRPGSLKEVFD